VKALRDIGLLFRRYGMQMLRNPVWLVGALVTPILYLALFAPLLHAVAPGSHVLDSFLPGILAFVAYGAGVGPGFGVIFELRAGVIERLRVTPASRFAILVGPLLATAVQMLVFDGVLVAIGAAFGFHVHPLGLGLLALLLGLLQITTAAFFVAMALLAKEINGFAALANGLNLPVLLLGGVLLPVSLGPLWLRLVAHVDPLYYVVDAARVLGAGTLAAASVWHAGAVLVPLCALVLVWATGVLRRAVA
jgi:ABC-2 type transport system permease protein